MKELEPRKVRLHYPVFVTFQLFLYFSFKVSYEGHICGPIAQKSLGPLPSCLDKLSKLIPIPRCLA